MRREWQSPREPDCIHSRPDAPQPASMCSTCKDGPELAAWAAYWEAHEDLIPPQLRSLPRIKGVDR